jgi:5-methylcytosine-specific restriction enzyme A
MAMLKLCRCGKMISAGLKRCEQCQEQYDKRHQVYDKSRRDKKSDAFYHSRAWIKLRNLVFKEQHGLCQQCYKEGRLTPGKAVDHIIPIKVNWALRLVKSNLQVLCQPCHNRKTLQEKKQLETPPGFNNFF